MSGEKDVRRRSRIQRVKNRKFRLKYVPTLEGEYPSMHYQLTKGKKNHCIKLSRWDINGEEKFASITRGYFVGSDAVMVLYDTSSRESWNRLPFWLELINADEDISTTVYLIGSKKDLYENREVPPEAIEEFTNTNTYKIDAVAEVSSKTGDGVDDLFINLVKLLVDTIETKAYEDGGRRLSSLQFNHKGQKCSC